MVYGAECWAVNRKEERKLHTTEMRMLRWARGNVRLDHVRNVDIWKEANMNPMAEFLREKRFGHVQRSTVTLNCHRIVLLIRNYELLIRNYELLIRNYELLICI